MSSITPVVDISSWELLLFAPTLAILVGISIPYLLLGVLVGYVSYAQKTILTIVLLLKPTVLFFYANTIQVKSSDILSYVFSRLLTPALVFLFGLWIGTQIKKIVRTKTDLSKELLPLTYKQLFFVTTLLVMIFSIILLISLNIQKIVPLYISGMEMLSLIFIGVPVVWYFWNKTKTQKERLILFISIIPLIGRLVSFIGFFQLRLFFDPIGYGFDMLGLILTFGDQGSQMFTGAAALIIWFTILFVPSYIYFLITVLAIRIWEHAHKPPNSLGNQ